MKSEIKNHTLRIWALAFFLTAILPAFTSVKEDLFKISKNLDIFSALYRQISLNYVDETDPDKLIKVGIDAMLEELDPYTEHVLEEDVEDYKMKYVNTHYGGIGAAIVNREGKIVISEPYANYPAQLAGLMAGDEIISVNGEAVTGKSSGEVSNLLKGPKNTAIAMVIKRSGQHASEEKRIVRDDITQPNVSRAMLLDGAVGYIKLDKFLERSAQEVQEAIINLQKKANLSGLVLDLRNNGGGILQEAVRIVNLFVQQGETVVSQRGKNSTKQQTYLTKESPLAGDVPMVVLINNRSASASEIVAGAIQDLDRGVVVGQRSFGKGLVQQTFNLPYNNLVKVTIAKYYTPSGRCIQALDYTHRDELGQVPKIVDSLISEYKTKGGRSVYDGSGIFPDVEIHQSTYSPITQTLVNRFLIFDYATQFRQKHNQILQATDFTLSETQYADFLNYLLNKDYQYKTKTESTIAQLKREAGSEKKSDTILSEIARLEKMISVSKEHDLITHKDEIKEVLGNEIVSRYYYQDGRTDYNCKFDKALQHATQLLSGSKQQYLAILAGMGDYKTIGNPHLLASGQ